MHFLKDAPPEAIAAFQRIAVPRSQKVRIGIFHTQGRRIRTLLNRIMNPGAHEISRDGRNQRGEVVAAGIFYYVMPAGSFREMKKMAVVR